MIVDMMTTTTLTLKVDYSSNLSVRRSVRPSVRVFVHPYIRQSFRPYIRPSARLSLPSTIEMVFLVFRPSGGDRGRPVQFIFLYGLIIYDDNFIHLPAEQVNKWTSISSVTLAWSLDSPDEHRS